ncbi:unnamed protein product [Prunus armeniaca]
MGTMFRWSGEHPMYDKPELCTLKLHHFDLLKNSVYKGGKVCFADNCVDDYLSLLDLKKIGAELRYKVDITHKVMSLKVFYKVHGEDFVNEILDDTCIANLIGTIPSNRVVVVYFHDPTDQNTLGSIKEEVWPPMDSEEYANVAEEEHMQVEFDGNEANNEEVNVEVESTGSESENEEKDKDKELKNSDYEYTEDEMSNIDPGMTTKKGANVLPNVGEEEPNIDPEMVPPNEERGAISDDGEDIDALPYKGETSKGEDENGENSKKRKLLNFK